MRKFELDLEYIKKNDYVAISNLFIMKIVIYIYIIIKNYYIYI